MRMIDFKNDNDKKVYAYLDNLEHIQYTIDEEGAMKDDLEKYTILKNYLKGENTLTGTIKYLASNYYCPYTCENCILKNVYLDEVLDFLEDSDEEDICNPICAECWIGSLFLKGISVEDVEMAQDINVKLQNGGFGIAGTKKESVEDLREMTYIVQIKQIKGLDRKDRKVYDFIYELVHRKYSLNGYIHNFKEMEMDIKAFWCMYTYLFNKVSNLLGGDEEEITLDDMIENLVELKVCTRINEICVCRGETDEMNEICPDCWRKKLGLI